VKINDAVWGVLFILGAAAVLIHVQGFPRIPGQNVGPGLFPGVIATGIALCGVILIVRGLRARSAGVPGAGGVRWIVLAEWLRSPRHLTAFAVFVAVNVLYVFVVDKLGFLLTGFLYLLTLTRILRVRWPVAIPVCIATTLVIHYAFYKLLKVPLPWGVLTPIAW
jgi:putative tricarboxylic transport membrane protein